MKNRAQRDTCAAACAAVVFPLDRRKQSHEIAEGGHASTCSCLRDYVSMTKFLFMYPTDGV